MVWITESLRGLTATHEALRVDRQLDEALTRGPDPLHLAAVFGIDEETAIRYANVARALLESPAERHEDRPTARTQGSDRPTGLDDP